MDPQEEERLRKAFGIQVRQARKARDWSQEQLAKAVGSTQSTIDRIESGLVRRSRIAPELGALLDIGVPLILSNPHVLSPPQRSSQDASELPLYASAEGGPGIIVIGSEPIGHVQRPEPLMNVDNAFAVYVVGDSMEPEFEPGDTAFINPRLPPIPGTTCVFSTNNQTDDRATIKRLIRTASNAWHVRQWNPPPGAPAEFTLDRSEWPVCHRVVGKYSRR